MIDDSSAGMPGMRVLGGDKENRRAADFLEVRGPVQFRDRNVREQNLQFAAAEDSALLADFFDVAFFGRAAAGPACV